LFRSGTPCRSTGSAYLDGRLLSMIEARHGLLHGPLSPRTVHLCLDMQKLFAPGGPWVTPWMERVLPVVVQLCEAFPERTVFTRFIPPKKAEAEIGVWRRFYTRWHEVTLQYLDPSLLELVGELARFVPPAIVVDKGRFSAFAAPALAEALNARDTDTLILSGAETDVCVLATVLGAVDRGYRVVIVDDAICSSSDEGHDALLNLYRDRFSEQIETISSQALLRE
jgi:nicotinamidase-related amidase